MNDTKGTLTADARRSLSDAYAAMMNTDAWENLVKWSRDQREVSLAKQDAVSITELNLNIVCEERGIRKGILKLIQHAEQCREGV